MKGHIAVCMNCGFEKKAYTRMTAELCNCGKHHLQYVYVPKKPCQECGVKNWELEYRGKPE